MSAYSVPPADGTPLFQSLKDVLDKHFKKQAGERIVRLSDEFDPETKLVESWVSPKNGSTALFDAENHSVRCVIYDPRVFSTADFYLTESDVEALAPAIREIKESHDKLKSEIEKIGELRQKKRGDEDAGPAIAAATRNQAGKSVKYLLFGVALTVGAAAVIIRKARRNRKAE
jgi:hypothetical protein